MLHKTVNGEHIQMSEEEEAAIRSEWDRDARKPVKPSLSIATLVSVLKAKGILNDSDLP